MVAWFFAAKLAWTLFPCFVALSYIYSPATFDPVSDYLNKIRIRIRIGINVILRLWNIELEINKFAWKISIEFELWLSFLSWEWSADGQTKYKQQKKR